MMLFVPVYTWGRTDSRTPCARRPPGIRALDQAYAIHRGVVDAENKFATSPFLLSATDDAYGVKIFAGWAFSK